VENITMSKRNSQAAKTAARERLRIERERQAKRDKVKRQLIVAGSLVGVLAIAGGISYAVQGNKPDHWEAAADAKLVKPANTSGENGTTVVIGKSDAKKTLELYEDPRCPVCATFEQTVGKTIEKDVEDGKYKIRFVGASFLDRNLTGEGSKNALSAMGAALNVSPEAFLAYKSALYSAEYHPEETDDKFKDDSYLIKIANTVDALEMSEVFDKSEAQGTPTLMMDGKKLTGSDGQNAPMTVAEFTTAVDKALKA
jgi:protein-disulfide isomerase